MLRKFLFCFSLSFVFLFASCVRLARPDFSPEEEAALYPLSSYIPESFAWDEVRPGVFRLDYENKAFPIIYHAVKIDLELIGEELSIDCFPNRTSLPEDFTMPYIYKGIRTQEFAKRSGCIVAMNLSPFVGKSGSWDIVAKLGSTRQIVGLHLADGFLISEPVTRYAALAFKKEKRETGESFWRAFIEKNQNEKIATEYDFAFGGFYAVLEKGKILDFKSHNHDSRSGAGISQDGHFLYLLVVEGEHLFKSEGLSYPQCGEIFRALGCSDALEMDGGGSSDLCINGKSVLSYKVRRVQANSFGLSVK